MDGPVLQVACAFDRRDDDACRVVRLDAAVEEMERLDDPARVEDVRHRHALLQERLRVLRGVLAVRDAHVGRLEPGVEDRLADRLHGHRPRRAPGATRVLRLSDADDAVLVPEPATLDDHPSGASSVFWTLGLSPRYPAAA